MRELSVFGIAGAFVARRVLLDDRHVALVEPGERPDPVEVLGDAVGEGLEHVVGRVSHVGAQLLEVGEEVVATVGPQHASVGVGAVAVAVFVGPLFQQQAGGAVPLDAHRHRRGHPREAPAHHDDVELLVPGDLVRGGRQVVLSCLG